MAKENYMILFVFICTISSFSCKADETEVNEDEYYDYNTDQPAVTTTENILITTLRNEHISNKESKKNNSENTSILRINKYLHIDSLIKNYNQPSKKTFNVTHANNTNTNNHENISIEFNMPENSMNTEYKVIHDKDVANISYEDYGHMNPASSENTASPEVVEMIHGSMQPSCARNCVKGEEPMTCYYKFNVEWYYSMSKACHNCSTFAPDCNRPDCITTNGIKRAIIVVNRTLPGPSIEVCQGDRIIVDVHNHLMEESTTIHWHGHHQRGSPYMDGVPFITQCPIPPHNVFRYNYIAATPGTHFWHSHTGCQRTDGAVGNMIIRTPRADDPHSHLYDEDLSEHVINIMDWAHELGVTMFLAHYHSDGDNKPESIIINGKGRYFKDSKNVTATPLATFNVKQGVRYRFRLINAGNQNCPIELTIDNHTIVAINSDGGNFKPVEGTALVTYAGERWDFILEATASVKNYWMRFKGLMDCDERFTKAHQVAILHYEGAPEEEPHEYVDYFGPQKTGLTINAMNVRIDDPDSISVPELTGIDIDNDPSLNKNADRQFYIGYDFYQVDANKYHKPTLYGFTDVKNPRERVYTPQFNHISMKMPTLPLLSQRNSVSADMFCDHKLLKNCTGNIQCECTNVIEIPLGDVVELILIDEGNTYNANHPFHLHGHPFRVVGMDRLGENTSVDKVRSLDKAGHLRRNLKSAPLKDSVTVPDGGYTIIRFHATNPGYWLFHCHLEFHVEVGMALIFKVGEHHQFPPVPEGFPTCGDYLFPKLPSEKPEKFSTKENEVNFGEDYGINTTHHQNDEEAQDKGFKLSQLWKLKPVSNSGTSIAVSNHKYLLSVFISGLLLLHIVHS